MATADAVLVPGEFLAHALGWLLIPTVGPAVAVSGVIVVIAWRDRRMQRAEPESVVDAEEANDDSEASERRALRVFRGVALAVAIGLLPACGSDAKSIPSSASQSPPAPASSPQAPKTVGPVKIDVDIAGGDVRPKAARIEVKVGQKVVFAVTSDVAEELHVHSDPAQSFKIQPGKYQEFSFAIDVPGQVEVEAEAMGVSIATIVVRP